MLPQESGLEDRFGFTPFLREEVPREAAMFRFGPSHGSKSGTGRGHVSSCRLTRVG